MRKIFFDAGPVISLAMNNLLWILSPMKRKFSVDFLITPSVKNELVNKPLKTKRFRLEALQTLSQIEDGILRVESKREVVLLSKKLMSLANSSFYIDNRPMTIVHPGEIETVAAALVSHSDGVVIDERTTRLLLEDPESLLQLLKHRTHFPVDINKKSLNQIRDMTSELHVIRSSEIALIAYESGIFDHLSPRIPNGKLLLLEAVLWRLKLNGCAITRKEIASYVKEERLH